jgi:hypothetical protein
MNRRAACAIAVLVALWLVTGATFGSGLGIGPLCYTVDTTGTFAKVPLAADAAFDALEAALVALGIPPSELDEARQEFDDALDAVEAGLHRAPTLVPVPLLGGFVDVSLSLGIVDGIRFGGGFITEDMVRGIADLFGATIPEPLFQGESDVPGFGGSMIGDVDFSSWMLVTELTKRLDVFVAAVEFGAGVHLVRGVVTPRIEVSPELETLVRDALVALHLDGLAWSAFGTHATVGLEVGLPFLRLRGDVRFVLPVIQSTAWWDVRLGGIMATIGMVIRF